MAKTLPQSEQPQSESPMFSILQNLKFLELSDSAKAENSTPDPK